MSLQSLTEEIRTIAENSDPIGKKIKFEFEDGCIHIDATGDVAVVTNDDNEADCVIKMKEATFEKLKAGKLNPMMAIMTGKIKIKGDKGLALKLQDYMK